MIKISVDDGCASDTRIAELCRKYNIEAVFYWPVEWHSLAYDNGYEPLSYYAAGKIADDFEIGSHTITHRHLTKLPFAEAASEIGVSKYMLEKIFGREITKFCPPRGYTNSQLTEFTLTQYQSQRLTKGEHLVHIHPDSGANGNMPWRHCITDKTTELWCHSWELDKYDMWEDLEDFLSIGSFIGKI